MGLLGLHDLMSQFLMINLLYVEIKMIQDREGEREKRGERKGGEGEIEILAVLYFWRTLTNHSICE